MTNDIISWIIIIATLFSILVIAYAGFLLIFSRGNRAALEQGKQLFFNTVIGIIIMVAGWTIVDTVMKLILDGDFGMWNQVQCGAGEFAAGAAEYEITLEEEGIGVAPGTVLTIDGVDIASCDTSQIVSTTFLGNSIQIHSSLVSSLESIDREWRRRGGNSAYNVYSVGGYACRTIAGSSRQSYHSYGVAVDINPASNPHRFDGVCQSDLPDWLIQSFRSQGWGWGCDWRSSKDAMHFSKARSEGGNLNVTR